MPGIGTSSADEGSGISGPNLASHGTGNPIGDGPGGSVTVGHTLLIILGALLLLWVLGIVFKRVRL